jgi:hypothetical protein
MYKHRLQTLTTTDCPPYFLQLKYIKAAYATTKVWNVFANHDDSEILVKELKNALNSPELRQFYPWAEYNSLHQSQEVTIVQLNNTFNNDYKSLLLSGFNTSTTEDHMMWIDNYPIQQSVDNGNWEFQTDQHDITMHDEDITDRFHHKMNLTTTTVSTFIQQNFLSGNETNIFAHVHDPIRGTREALVTRNNIPEALNLIKCLNVELARVMNNQAIQTVFETPEYIITATTTTQQWHPFDIQKTIPHAQYSTYSKHQPYPQTKRQRHSSKPNHPTTMTYTDAASTSDHETAHYSDITDITSPTTSTTPTPLNPKTPLQPINTNKQDQLNHTLSDIQREINTLKASFTALESNVQKTNRSRPPK